MIDGVRLRLSLEGVLEAIRSAAPEELPDVIAELVRCETLARLRLAAPAPAVNGPDKLLTAREAAARLGMSVRWLYEHRATLPFALRVGNAVRFSEHGLARWQATAGKP